MPRILRAIAVLPALLAAFPAGATEEAGEDLATMAERYGWRVVASVVATADQGDQTAADVHRKLDAMGLGRLQVPVRDELGLGLSPMTGCGWNGGVVCPLTLPPGAPDEAGFAVRCAGDGPAVVLRAVASPEPTPDTPGTAWVEGLERCWRSGTPGVRVGPPAGIAPAPLVATSGGPLPGAVTQAVAAHAEALAACGPGLTTLTLADDGTLLLATASGPTGETLAPCVAGILADVAVDARAGLPDLLVQTPVRTPDPETE